MKIGTKILIFFLTLNFLSCKNYKDETETKKQIPEFVHTEIGFSLPDSIEIINDFGNVLTEFQRIKLKTLISNYINKTTKEIVIVTIDSIKPYKDIQKYATDLGNDWVIGAPKWNNGLTIVICNPCNKIGIATGGGTEKILTDEICKEIIEKTIIPEFKKENYYNGIEKGIKELMSKWE